MVFLDLTQGNKPQITKIGDMTIYTTAGKVHRTDGPAIITSWSKEWFIDGVTHRDDGPAKMYLKHPKPSGKESISNGGKNICEWYFNGVYSNFGVLDDKTFQEHWNK